MLFHLELRRFDAQRHDSAHSWACMSVCQREMKVVAAYLLAVLGGNTTPSADDIEGILGSGKFSPPFVPALYKLHIHVFGFVFVANLSSDSGVMPVKVMLFIVNNAEQ